MPDLAQSYKRAPQGVSVGEFPMDVVVNFSAGTPGTLLTPTDLTNGMHGANWGAWQAYKDGVPDRPNTYTYVVNHPVVFPGSIVAGGVRYTGAEGQGATFDLAGAPSDDNAWLLRIASQAVYSCIILYLFQFLPDFGASDYFNDTFAIASGAFTVPQFRRYGGGSSKQATAHTNLGYGKAIDVAERWMIACVKHDGTNLVSELYVQDAASLEVIGASYNTLPGPPDQLGTIKWQTYLRGAGQGAGQIRYKLIAMRTSNLTWPPYAIPVPIPSGVAGVQTGAGTISVTWTSPTQLFLIERNVNASGWAILDSAYSTNTPDTYVDATVSAGQSVQYRVTSLIGSQSSSATSSNVVVVT